MSVVNELTSEVTVIVLNRDAARDSQDLKQVLLAFHSTLSLLSEEARRRRRAKFFPESGSPLNTTAPPLSH
jgi:hypothetical protein